MTKVIAAIDNSLAARPTASRLAGVSSTPQTMRSNTEATVGTSECGFLAAMSRQLEV